ncbi:MAG: SoxR reducing system RseC family protein [Nitrospirae bacterium]|nr:SoxR reducing system RseC family protein [Nitrospirota bacterium]
MQSSEIETGTVLKTEGTQALVITNKSKSCKECGKAQAGICGKSGSGMVLKVDNQLGAERGDTVELGLEATVHVKGYLLIFILPVIALFIAAYAGHALSQLTGVLYLDVSAGLAGLISAVIYSFRTIRKLDKSTQLHITKILYGPSEYGVGSCAEEIDYLHAFNKSS